MSRLAPLVAIFLLLALAPVAVRAVDVDWGEPRATVAYGEQISFSQPATLSQRAKRVELLIDAPGGIGSIVNELPAVEAGRTELNFSLDLATGHILPNTTMTARWRVVGDDGTEATGPPVTIRYEDTRFDWRTREGDVVRVHWYEGSDAFGERALEIGERAVRETAELLGVTEDEPVDFFVYADQDEFYEALGPGTRENVGGQANADIRTRFSLITPGEINDPWVGIVIPHELVHLVFDTAVDNPYHFPPRWLNEGLAVHLSQGYEVSDRAAVQSAVNDGTLIPLSGLTGQFPTTRDRFFLAYAESVAAVDYFIAEHGQDAMVELVRSYATGLTDDEAFEQAIGLDVAEFDAAWRAQLDAREPTEYGPQPAPPGPLPPGWTTAEGSPGATLAPIPGSPGGPASPLPGNGDPDDGLGIALTLGILGAALLAVGAVAIVVVRRRRDAEREQVQRWAAWREERTPAAVGPPAAAAIPPASDDAGPLAGTATRTDPADPHDAARREVASGDDRTQPVDIGDPVDDAQARDSAGEPPA